MFLQQLGQEHPAAVPAVDHARRVGGRVADVGCGFGWSSIGVALAHPDATVDGFDIDAPSIEQARENAAADGVADRIRLHVVDAGEDDPIERIMYGFSLLCCLPDGRAHERSVTTGTVMRPATLEGDATAAGFVGIEVLPMENDFFRFYRLVPTGT